MGIIRVLDGHVADLIAAGEVVERPASVVKELVENAVDAGASKVDVTAEDGGLASIRVTDDGCGMDRGDLRLAFARHATSKIRTDRDLFRIRTLGFRGEALASIAAVSRVTCVSSDREDGLGWRIVLEGGAETDFGETAAPRGTDMIVRDLFYNTPARLKYMKTVQTEMGHISDYMYRLALSRPDIAFSLKHNGSVLLQTTGNGDLLQVIAAIYGRACARHMVPLAAENADYALSGWIGRPEVARSGRHAMTVAVNGRYVRNAGLARVIQQAYHTLLPINRYPLLVLHLRMDPTLVDVNVHPAKLEVRFSKERELFEFVEEAIRRTLGAETLIPDQRPADRAVVRERVVQERMPLYGPADDREKRHDGGAAGAGHAAAPPYREAGPAAAGAAVLESGTKDAGMSVRPHRPEGGGRSKTAEDGGLFPPARDGRDGPDKPGGTKAANASFRAASRAPSGMPATGGQAVRLYEPPAGKNTADAAPAFPELHPIGQAHGTYIVAQNEDGLYLIDQHAAHERINYERYLELFGNPDEASQELLVPLTLEFTPAEAKIIERRLSVLAQAGVRMEPFGGSAFIVRSCPHWFPKGEERQIIEEMAAWLLEEKDAVDIAGLREKSAILCACRHSRKANEPLTVLEMQALIDRLAACQNPFTCPHGRPIIVRFTKYELEKMFKRVM